MLEMYGFDRRLPFDRFDDLGAEPEGSFFPALLNEHVGIDEGARAVSFDVCQDGRFVPVRVRQAFEEILAVACQCADGRMAGPFFRVDGNNRMRRRIAHRISKVSPVSGVKRFEVAIDLSVM